MEEKLMINKEIEDEIRFEDECGMNTLLQNLLHFKDTVNVFQKINKKDELAGWVIRDKITGRRVQL